MGKSVIPQLASQLDRRDEVPNQVLAKQIVDAKSKSAIKELVENLGNKKAIANDCIKVLYEVGAVEPKLIAPHLDAFVAILHSKNNRLQWGGMTALGYISKVKPAEVYAHLTDIMDAAGKGSVITRDGAVHILINLASTKKFGDDAFALLNEQLLTCPTNQLPMYAERAMPVITSKTEDTFVKSLTKRLPDIEKESKRKRVEKVITKISK